MFRHYTWPRQAYATDPAVLLANNPPLPRDIASAAWLKRSNVMGVLENRLPFEFADSAEQPGNIDCNDCEILIDEKNNMVYEEAPIPEVPMTEGVAEAAPTAGPSKARTGQTARSAPVQTGAPRHRQHIRHQDFHNRGRDT
jgi:hypothetical protein